MLTLFSFATKRYPQALRGEIREELFIEITRQIAAATHYLSALDAGDFRSLRGQLTARARTFSGRLTVQDIRSTFPNLIRLFERARRMGDDTLIADIETIVDQLAPSSLTFDEQVGLWDNLMHAIWVERSQVTADAIIAVMVGDRVADAFRALDFPTNGDATAVRSLRRASLARVVLPLPIRNVRSPVPPRPLSLRQRKMLEAAHDRFVKHYEADELDAAIHAFSTEFAARRRDVDAEETEEREARESRFAETFSALGPDIRARILPMLHGTIARGEPRRIASREISERLPAVAGRRMAHFVAEDRAADTAITLAAASAARARASAPIFETTAHRATFYAFGTEIAVEETIPPAAVIVRGVRDHEGGTDYYLTYHHAQQQPRLGMVVATVDIAGALVTENAAPLPELHENFQTFRLTPEPVTGNSVELRLQLVRSDSTLSDALSLPPLLMVGTEARVFTVDFTAGEVELPEPPPLFGVHALGVIDFRRVEQELSCYVTSYVSHVENIMASEYKEKVARSLSVLETEEEVSSEFSAERTSDTESEKKQEMNAEVSAVLNEETRRGFNISAGVVGEFPGGEITTSVGYNHNSMTSREDSSSQAVSFAETVTRRVQEKILQKQTRRRRALARREQEVTSKHGFDNRNGQEHVVGVYRWVDKILDNRLVNYGRRSVLEFEVPEPARNFIKAQEKVAESEDFDRKPPRTLKQAGLTKPEDLTRENYLLFARQFAVVPEPPPAEFIQISRAFKEAPGETGAPLDSAGSSRPPSTDILSTAAYNDIEIPPGYVTTHAKFWTAPEHGSIYVSVGDTDFFEEERLRDLAELSGMVSVAILAWSLTYAVTVRIDCKLTDIAFREWQLATYHMIRESYRERRQNYLDAKAEHEAETKSQEADLNPRFKRALMEKELKRICIEMLTEPFKPLGVDFAQGHYVPGNEGEFDTLIQSAALESHSRVVRFFEEVIDWQLAAYTFYPYFYADRADWQVKVGMETTRRSVFESFLTSGMARIVIPICKGFEDAMSFYLETGEVWFGGGFVLDVRDDLYLGLAEEMIDSRDEAFVEKAWQTQLPTDLTILQSRAAALPDDGLPCAVEELKLATGESQLDPVLPPSDTLPNSPPS